MSSCDSTSPYYQEFQTITQQLRCPVCDGQRISSSHAPFALSVKRDVCNLLHEGVEYDNIIPQIEANYGQSMRVQSVGDNTLTPLLIVFIIMVVAAILIVRKLTQTG